MADKIFFSYSRFDSAFVLRLANELRNAGANVWLDQLDISPGKRWDSEIEKALNEANCVLAIISPKSLASDNAMDEISYALEEKKKVIPILLTNTETPFRLRRLQRVDFTNDYDSGFRQLLLALKVQELESAFVKNEAGSRGKDNKEQADEDQKLWEECCALNTVAGYQQYLNNTTLKHHVDDAWHRLDTLYEKPLSRAIKLPRNGKEAGSMRNKRSILIAGLMIPVAAIALGTFKMINKKTPEKDTVLNAVQSLSVPHNENPPVALVDTVTLQHRQAAINEDEVFSEKQPDRPLHERKPSLQKTSEQNAISSSSNSNDALPHKDTMSEATSAPAPGTAVVETPVSSTKKEVVIYAKVPVSLLLIDMPDMHERKKTDQPVTFTVTDDVVFEGEIIIRKGAIAKGTLTIGRIQTDIRINKVDGANGNIIYLRSEREHGRRNEVEKNKNYTAFINIGTRIE